ncbi:hypothetical protein CGRA01v4_14315 [Colletotrichum graminicola]|nr:hypothetical protein CGRA01v4_14315 [Colletotrichum graminicola]
MTLPSGRDIQRSQVRALLGTSSFALMDGRLLFFFLLFSPFVSPAALKPSPPNLAIPSLCISIHIGTHTPILSTSLLHYSRVEVNSVRRNRQGENHEKYRANKYKIQKRREKVTFWGYMHWQAGLPFILLFLECPHSL